MRPLLLIRFVLLRWFYLWLISGRLLILISVLGLVESPKIFLSLLRFRFWLFSLLLINLIQITKSLVQRFNLRIGLGLIKGSKSFDLFFRVGLGLRFIICSRFWFFLWWFIKITKTIVLLFRGNFGLGLIICNRRMLLFWLLIKMTKSLIFPFRMGIGFWLIKGSKMISIFFWIKCSESTFSKGFLGCEVIFCDLIILGQTIWRLRQPLSCYRCHQLFLPLIRCC